MVVAIFVTGVSTIMGGINYVTTVIRLRAPGMTYMRMPLTVWGLWLTAILNVLFVPVLGLGGAAAAPRPRVRHAVLRRGRAAAQGGGDPILFQHLFWIFGHPEVYILILPAWGIVGDLLSFFCRKPAYWYKGSVLAMIAVTVPRAVVYGHHMFVTGHEPAARAGLHDAHADHQRAGRAAVPQLAAHHLEGLDPPHHADALRAGHGVRLRARRPHRPLPRARSRPDIYLHDTMFVVGHFHFTMAAASFLASFAAHLLLVPQDVRPDDERAAGQGALLDHRGGHHPGLRRAAARRLLRASTGACTTRSSTSTSSPSGR